MSAPLSQRIRPDVECAPWVRAAVVALEYELNEARAALSRISLAEHDSTTSAANKVRDMGRTARAALAGVGGAL